MKICLLHINLNSFKSNFIKSSLEEFETLEIDYREESDVDSVLNTLKDEEADVLILESSQLTSNILSILKTSYKHKICTIVVSEVDEKTFALSCFKNGVQDVLIKNDINPDILEKAIKFNLKSWKSNLKNEQQETKKYIRERSELLHNFHVQSYALDQHSIVCVYNKTGKIVYANKKFCDLSGYDFDEVTSSNFKLQNLQNLKDSKDNNIWNEVSSGDDWQGEIELHTKNGSTVWLQTSLVSRKDDKRQIQEFISISTNITDFKEAEKKISERESSLSALINSVENEIFAVDLDYKLIIFNELWLENFKSFFGIELHKGIDLSNLPNLPKEIFQKWKPRYNRAFEGESFKVKDHYHTIDGDDKYLNISITPYRNSSNKIIGAVVYTEDVTKLTEAQIEEKHQKNLMSHLAKINGALVNVKNFEQFNQLICNGISGFYKKSNSICICSKIDLIKNTVTIEEISGHEGFESLSLIKNKTFENVDTNDLVDDGRGKKLQGKLNSLEGNPKFLENFINEEIQEKFPLYSTEEIYYHQYNQTLGIINIIQLTPEKGIFNTHKLIENVVAQFSSTYLQLKSKEQIKESETRLKLAINSSKGGIYDVDIINKKYFYDERFANIFGFKPEELIEMGPKNILDRIHLEDRSKITKNLFNLMKANQKAFNFQHEFRIKHKKGHYVWVHDSGMVLDWNKRRITKMVGVHTDQTKRKQRQKQLQLFESVITNANDSVMICQKEINSNSLKIVYANRAFLNMSGYKLIDAIGKGYDILNGPKTSKKSLRNIEEAIKQEEQYQTEILNYNKSGKSFWTDLNFAPVFDSNGDVNHFIIIQRDITERKKRRLELKKALTRLELATRTSKIGIWEYNPRKDHLIWDNSMFELYEIQPENFTKNLEAWKRSIHSEDKERAEKQVELTLSENVELDMTFRILTPSQKTKYISVIAQTEVNNGKVTKLVGINWDVTDQIEAKLKIENALQEREDILNSMSDGFFAINKNFNITYWSNSAEEILQKNGDETLGQNIKAIDCGINNPEFINNLESALRANKIKSFAHYISNLEKWIETTVYPKDDGLSVFFRDITSEYIYQEEVDKIKQNREALMNSTSDLIWSIDSDMNLVSANESFIKHFERLTGHKIFEGDFLMTERYNKSYVERWKVLYQRALNGNEVKLILGDNPNDDKLVLSVSLYPIFDNENKVVGAACYSKDVSERYKHLKALENQNRYLTEIAWEQSHMVRAPLSNILGIVNLLNSDEVSDQLNSDTKELLELLIQSSEDLDKIIYDITRKTEAAKFEDFKSSN